MTVYLINSHRKVKFDGRTYKFEKTVCCCRRNPLEYERYCTRPVKIPASIGYFSKHYPQSCTVRGSYLLIPLAFSVFGCLLFRSVIFRTLAYKLITRLFLNLQKLGLKPAPRCTRIVCKKKKKSKKTSQ